MRNPSNFPGPPDAFRRGEDVQHLGGAEHSEGAAGEGQEGFGLGALGEAKLGKRKRNDGVSGLGRSEWCFFFGGERELLEKLFFFFWGGGGWGFHTKEETRKGEEGPVCDGGSWDQGEEGGRGRKVWKKKARGKIVVIVLVRLFCEVGKFVSFSCWIICWSKNVI